MTALAWRCVVGLLLLASFSSRTIASPRPGRVAVIDDVVAGELQLELVGSEVADAVRRAGMTALGPSEVRAAVELDGALAERRQLAKERLVEATGLVNNVRYDEALTRLAAAEREALAGLAAIVAPRLLADIHLQRGLALLATDAAAAQRWFVLSFQLWPKRPLDETDHAPRILQALRQAARAARAARPQWRMRATEAARLARLATAQAILAVQARFNHPERRVRVTVRRFDPQRSAWSGATTLDWPVDASAAEVREALRPVAGLLPSGAPEGSSRPQRTAAWVLFGVSAATLATGIGLTFHAVGQIDEARSLANLDPKVEYWRARDLEDSAVRSRTGAIVSYSLGAAALVAGLVLWLRDQPRRPTARISVAPGGASVALSLP